MKSHIFPRCNTSLMQQQQQPSGRELGSTRQHPYEFLARECSACCCCSRSPQTTNALVCPQNMRIARRKLFSYLRLLCTQTRLTICLRSRYCLRYLSPVLRSRCKLLISRLLRASTINHSWMFPPFPHGLMLLRKHRSDLASSIWGPRHTDRRLQSV